MPTALDASILDSVDRRVAPVRLRKARSLEEMDALEAGWRDLDAECSGPLGQFIWTRAALAAFAEDATPCIVAATRGEKVLALAPLARRRLHGTARLCLAGVSQLFEPGDFVWSDPRALDRLVRALVRGGAPLFFERIGVDSPTTRLLLRRYRGRAIVLARPQAACPYIALDDTWLEPESHLNSGRRSDLRRARRKAEQLGTVSTEIHTPDLKELPELLDVAFHVEASSWKGAAGTALVHDTQRAVFYRQYAEAACVDGILRICFLRIGDRVAAMQLAVEQGGGFWLLKVGYDARYASCSPGMLLMRDTIRYAAESGLTSYEFLGRAESWTEVWTSVEHAYISLRVYPFGVRGLSALIADAAVAGFRRWRKS